ncbi:Glutamate ABC transporter, solute-binding protein [Sodalis praecaptivus]|uniref:Glutamate ABC transporter, solute-binding protein n=1 Tax=Sodalis praecaptivus TaxID=1239307 RepID=W0HWM0_9GAMM|nr:glutamate ABC transporter substrate-binding protein [Sodalis praecaptivus]AHF76595.1 Glutamate ABC transporter, solute-binding protein [Sodalis praecaptivus]
MTVRFFSLLLALCLTVAAAAQGAYAADFPAGSTMARLAKAPTLRIGVKYDQPLFGMRNLSGQPEGFDIDLATLIAGKLGFPPDKITWVETSAPNREPFLQQNRVDLVIATYTITEKRRKVVNQAGPYLVGGQVLMVKKGNPQRLTGPQDLVNKKACVLSGSTGQNYMMTHYPSATLVPFDVVSKCFEALKNGSVDAIVSPNHVLAGLVKADPDGVEMVGVPFLSEPIGVGMSRQAVDLCQFVLDVLRAADADGSYAAIYARHVKPWLGGEGKLPPLDPCPTTGA